MSDLKIAWERFRFNLSEVKVITHRELQQKDCDGEWELREPESYLLTDSAEEACEKFEAQEELRFSGSRRIQAVIQKDLHERRIFDGVPKSGSVYDTEGVNELCPSSIEIYEEVKGRPIKDVKKGFLLRDGGEFHLIFTIPKSEFGEVISSIETGNSQVYVECSVKGLIGSIEGGGVFCFFSPEVGRNKYSLHVELYKVCCQREIGDHSVVVENSESMEGKAVISQAEGVLIRQLSELQGQMNDVRFAAFSIAILILIGTVVGML